MSFYTRRFLDKLHRRIAQKFFHFAFTILIAMIGWNFLTINAEEEKTSGSSTDLKKTAIKTVINDNCDGYWEILPTDYATSNQTYPLFLFLHGKGGLGSALENIFHGGMLAKVVENDFPKTFTSKGKTYSFIFIGPQFKRWPSPENVNDILEMAVKKYRVDMHRIYVSGQSMGGGATWDLAGNPNPNFVKITAIAPICGASPPEIEKAKIMAQKKLPVWAFHNQDDPTVNYSNSVAYVQMINSQQPTIPAKLTVWPKGGHNAWTKAYDPNYKEDGMNIYEWLLQFEN
jgi:predicted peptidase